MKEKRKSPDGVATNNLIFSTHIGSNNEVFPNILSLYVSDGAKIADVTYGKGVFWRKINEGRFDLYPTDLLDGVDCRDLPYANNTMDCVVLDPPYMHTPGGTAHSSHQNFELYYQNNAKDCQKMCLARLDQLSKGYH